MPLIIIEGCDNSGKTTLVNNLYDHLLKRVDVQKTKSIPPWKNEDKARKWLEDILKYCHSEEKWMIADRFSPISEPVYAKVVRKTEPIWPLDMMFPFIGQKTSIIHCTRTAWQIMNQEWDARVQKADGVTIDERLVRELITDYDYIMEVVDQLIGVIDYDWNCNMSMTNLMEKIQSNLSESHLITVNEEDLIDERNEFSGSKSTAIH